jgi:peptide/nickel transport system permease protein
LSSSPAAGLRSWAGGASRYVTGPSLGMYVARRAALGIVTLLAVSMIVFAATEVLPGNAAYAILGRTASPSRIRGLEIQLHLNRPIYDQYWNWLSGLVTGRLGNSLANGISVWKYVAPRLVNSAILMVMAGIAGSLIGVASGAYAALRKDRAFDHVMSVAALCSAALPEFVAGIGLVILFATVVLHWFPAVAVLPPGSYAWTRPAMLVLPTLTLIIVIVPYIFRMMRAATIEALESDYVEMARLKGLHPLRVVAVHALPNAIAPTVQVIGLTFLYLSGGIIVVEVLFNYPGVGQGLVNAVEARDLPTIQLIVVILAAFYIVFNIVTDVCVLLATPRRRFQR